MYPEVLQQRHKIGRTLLTDVLNSPGETDEAPKPRKSTADKLRPLVGSITSAAIGAIVAGMFLANSTASPLPQESENSEALPVSTERSKTITEEVIDPETVDAYEAHVPTYLSGPVAGLPTGNTSTSYSTGPEATSGPQQPRETEYVYLPADVPKTPPTVSVPPAATPSPLPEDEHTAENLVRTSINTEAGKRLSLSYDTAAEFTRAVYRAIGFDLPIGLGEQSRAGIQTLTPMTGDLVVWPDQHIGIYSGDGQVFHTPGMGRPVVLAPLWGTPIYVKLIDKTTQVLPGLDGPLTPEPTPIVPNPEPETPPVVVVPNPETTPVVTAEPTPEEPVVVIPDPEPLPPVVVIPDWPILLPDGPWLAV